MNKDNGNMVVFCPFYGRACDDGCKPSAQGTNAGCKLAHSESLSDTSYTLIGREIDKLEAEGMSVAHNLYAPNSRAVDKILITMFKLLVVIARIVNSK